MSPPLIETRGLSMRFGGVQAVRNVDFSVAEGELRCLIGPNGAGKSTFFKMLTGQLRPTSGTIFFRGADITDLRYDAEVGVLWLRHPGVPAGTHVEIKL